MLVGKALSFTHELFSFSFYESTVLSTCAVDDHHMYSGSSVIGKASTIGIEISPTPPLIFTGGGSKSAKFGVFSTSLNFEPLTFEKIIEFYNKSATLRLSPYVFAEFATHP